MTLEKVDDKTAYENLLVKYAELENKIADIKANCDLSIEGRDIKIMELVQENNKLLDVINNQDVKIADLEGQIEQAKEIIKEFVCHYNNKTIYVNNVKPLLEQAEQFIKEIEKMKCCQNCADGKSCENSGLVYVCDKWRFEK